MGEGGSDGNIRKREGEIMSGGLEWGKGWENAHVKRAGAKEGRGEEGIK